MATGLDFGPIRPTNGSWFFRGPIPRRTTLSVRFFPGSPACAGVPKELACPDQSSARILFRISALLDHRELVKVEGSAAELFAIGAAEPTIARLGVTLPRLSEGRHCLLVSVSEAPAVAVREQLPDHAVATMFQVISGTAKTDHCFGGKRRRVELQALASEIRPDCSLPMLSPAPDELLIRREVQVGDKLWAVAGRCAARATVVLAKDGVLQAAGSSFAPIFVPKTSPASVKIPLPEFPKGDWQLIAIQDAPTWRDWAKAAASEPVVVKQ